MRKPTASGVAAAPVALPSADAANIQRRRFLFSLGAGSAAAAATAALPAAATPAVAIETNDAGSGYRETQHVRDYYRTAKI